VPPRRSKNFPATLAGIAREQGLGRDTIEIWFADEARVGPKNGITRRWARRGTRPAAPQDQRYASVYIFGAVCPKEGKGAALVLPLCNTAAMTLHLAEISAMVRPGNHAVLLLDQAGWRLSGDVTVPANITLLPLPPKCSELNAMETIWQFLRGPKATPEGRSNWLSNRIFHGHDDIVDHCCHAWNKLVDQPWRITSVGLREWAHRSWQPVGFARSLRNGRLGVATRWRRRAVSMRDCPPERNIAASRA
jgi:hypothetical protein